MRVGLGRWLRGATRRPSAVHRRLFHTPIMPDEVLRGWLRADKRDGFYVDGTVGGGGHAEKLLEAAPGSFLLCLDRDPDALEFAERRLGSRFRGRVFFRHDTFANLRGALADAGFPALVDGVLVDLGVSSFQLDCAPRGFSFLRDGPLDMRLDQRSPAPRAARLPTFDEAMYQRWVEGHLPRQWNPTRAVGVDRPLSAPPRPPSDDFLAASLPRDALERVAEGRHWLPWTPARPPARPPSCPSSSSSASFSWSSLPPSSSVFPDRSDRSERGARSRGPASSLSSPVGSGRPLFSAGADVTAADLVNLLPEAELLRLFREYGEERLASIAARAIVRERNVHGATFATTGALADVLERALRRARRVTAFAARDPARPSSYSSSSSSKSSSSSGKHPATRCFQALRMGVNDELRHLSLFLKVAPDCLADEGRLAVITFHSLEDRMAKRRFRLLARRGAVELLGGPHVSSETEQGSNPRSRSAKLRLLERLTRRGRAGVDDAPLASRAFVDEWEEDEEVSENEEDEEEEDEEKDEEKEDGDVDGGRTGRRGGDEGSEGVTSRTTRGADRRPAWPGSTSSPARASRKTRAPSSAAAALPSEDRLAARFGKATQREDDQRNVLQLNKAIVFVARERERRRETARAQAERVTERRLGGRDAATRVLEDDLLPLLRRR